MAKKVRVMLGELLKERGITLYELSLKTDVRRAALSELTNGKRDNINFGHIERIAEALDITDIREIISIVDDKEDSVI